jgi:sugar lactone lactonase YvrE
MTWNGDLEAPAGVCSPVTTLSLWDAFDNAAVLSTSATLTLEASGDARFFDDAACGNAVSGLDLAAGASTANVYVLSPSVGTQTLTAAIGGIGVTNRSFTWRASLAWSGVSATVGLTESSGIAVRGRMDGQLNGPYHAAFDLSEHLYVSDTANNRIVKYSISSGSFEGWVGRVLSTPSGGTNVNCALAGNTTTPGWCTGGQPSTNSTSDLSWDGMYKAPQGVAVVGDFLYAVDSGNNRVVRLVAATGEFAGWIGQIGTYDATGGAAGCETAITGSVTPGWCFGGTSALGTQGGALSSPRDIESDGTWLYVSDMNNHRLSRYALATGAFAGWFGAVASTPTGGASGCASAAVNTVTPGWCLGGTSKTLSTLDGAFNKPQGLAVQDGKLFVADSANYRVQRLFLGADERVTSGGWIGKVGTTKPTGGVAGCTTVTNAQTPGWCLGGTPTSSGVTAEGNLSLPADVAVAGAFLFAADFGNGRVNRYDLESGAKAGWTGRIVSKPTGGEAGCTTAAVGAATPGWCTGGTPQLGVLLGSFYSPTGLVVDSRGLNLWTIDNALHRLVAIDVATGRSASWLGGKPEIPSAWSVVSPVPGAFGTFQSEGLNPGSSTDLFLSGTTLLMADMGNHRLRRMELSAPAAVDWIGNVFHTPTGGDTSCLTAPLNFGTPVWCRGGITRSGAGNNMFVNPQGVWSDGTYAYVADTGNHRIVRISLATGGFAGWIGRISTKPTGGASGCSTASLSATTPGWCLGGTAKSGVDDGQFNTPYGIVGGAGSLYVADTNNRITRIQAASGVMTGWVGRVLTVPTGGATGCASTAVGAATPGWCLGGTAQAGSSDGQFYGPRSLTLADGNLYVSDYSNNRIQRLSLLSGLMTGWVGYISTRPTGGMTGCTTATGKTPGWCTGGSARTGSVDGAYAGPRGITSDGTWLFIADSNNHRLARLDLATGAWQGWKGLIGNSRPTGGDTGCATAATGTVTPGWCVGGSPARGWTLGAFDTPVGLGNDGQNYLYVADTNNGRLVRVPK